MRDMNSSSLSTAFGKILGLPLKSATSNSEKSRFLIKGVVIIIKVAMPDPEIAV